MKTQAWGWLAAAVLAAGLNSSYHDGGLQWAHEIVDRVGHNTGAVLALATGRADQFLAEARMLNVGRQRPECPLAAAMADVQNSFDQSQFDRVEAMSAREQAQLVRIEANRARIETLVPAKLARIQIPTADFSPVVVKVPRIGCPRLRVNIPRIRRMNVAPTV